VRLVTAHLSWADIGIVAAGGAVGAGLRYGITLSVSTLSMPSWAGIPLATVGINVVGAFLLGVLLELLTRHGPDTGWSRRARLGLGTGGLGGFTTYSALATETVTLSVIHPGFGIAYALGTVIIGAGSTAAGIWLGRRQLPPALRTRRHPT
jgi:CrcB protein